MAPLLSIFLKFWSSSNAPSAERSRRKDVSMRLRVAALAVSFCARKPLTTFCQSSESSRSKMLNGMLLTVCSIALTSAITASIPCTARSAQPGTVLSECPGGRDRGTELAPRCRL